MKFHEIGRIHKLFTTEHDMLESKVLVNDCCFGVLPVIYPDPDPERNFNFCTINIFLFLIYNRIIENVFVYLFIYLLTPVYNLLEFVSLFITFFIYVFNNIIYWHS